MLVGIVGAPNKGKSTFFKALTLSNVEIADYPFTTIKPNHGVGYIKTACPCSEFKVKCEPQNSYCKQGKRFVPVELLDVAGIVPEASKGRGLGNQFLDDLRQASILIQVIDLSGKTDIEGRQVSNFDINQELGFFEHELDEWFYAIISKNWDFLVKTCLSAGKDLVHEIHEKLSGLQVSEEQVNIIFNELKINKNRPKLTDDMMLDFATRLRKISKPIIIAANKADLPEAEKNLEILKKSFPERIIIPCSAEIELALREASEKKLIDYVPGSSDFKILDESKLNDKQKNALNFMKKFLEKWKSTGVQQVINTAVFDILKMKVVFPVVDENKLTNTKNQVLPDAFLMPAEATSLELAFKVHTEIGKNFVRAVDCRTKKTVGKDTVLEDCAVVKIHAKS